MPVPTKETSLIFHKFFNPVTSCAFHYCDNFLGGKNGVLFICPNKAEDKTLKD